MSITAENDDEKKTELILNFHASDKDENAEYFSENLIEVANLIMSKSNKNKVKEIRKSVIK